MPRRVVHDDPREGQRPAASASGDGALPQRRPSLVIVLVRVQFLRGAAHVTAVARRAPRRRVAVDLLRRAAARHKRTPHGAHPHRHQSQLPKFTDLLPKFTTP
jgi:hypothetical protein